MFGITQILIQGGHNPNLKIEYYEDAFNAIKTKYPSSGLHLLKMIAISRIMYYGIIDHLQSSWLTNGIGMAQLALNYGADDFGGTLIGEEVVSATGAASTELTAQKIINAVKQIGFDVAERDNFYQTIKKC